ncbi:MAG: hypothetical protein P8J50_09555 [Acidimicrobiales bacterium]|nr:hypothetical protein [Acidimicrobiales bacterium]
MTDGTSRSEPGPDDADRRGEQRIEHEPGPRDPLIGDQATNDADALHESERQKGCRRAIDERDVRRSLPGLRAAQQVAGDNQQESDQYPVGLIGSTVFIPGHRDHNRGGHQEDEAPCSANEDGTAVQRIQHRPDATSALRCRPI